MRRILGRVREYRVVSSRPSIIQNTTHHVGCLGAIINKNSDEVKCCKMKMHLRDLTKIAAAGYLRASDSSISRLSLFG
jgi:hypothetical protein